MTEHARGAVLVTGAGRGIGREIAINLAASGYPLILVSKTAATLDDTVRLCAKFVPTRHLTVDVRRESDIKRLGQLLVEIPLLHAVVNNAGVGRFNPIEQVSMKEWDDQLETNLRGPFLVVRETLPVFRKQGLGLYVMIGSDLSLVGKRERAAYIASKFGLAGLTNAIRAEVNADGIHASMLFLGSTDSSFAGRTPGDRPGALRPEAVARAVTFVVDLYPEAVVPELCVMPRKDLLQGPRGLV